MSKAENNRQHEHFQEKEAAPNPRLFFNMMRNGPSKISNVFKNMRGNKDSSGQIITRPAQSTLDPDKVNIYSMDEVTDRAIKEKGQSTDSFALDALLGGTKMVFRGAREPIERGVAGTKQFIENIDTRLGTPIMGNNPDTLRGKLFSSRVRRQVGDSGDSDNPSPLERVDRRPSLFAPVEKAVRFSTPLLATSYVYEKLYPEEELGDNVNQTPYENNLEKSSSNDDDLFDQSITEEMDKNASLLKIAELENSLKKYANDLQELKMEKLAVEKELQNTLQEKYQLEKKAELAQQNLMQEKIAFEELRLRTIAKERSKEAVHLAEEMLDKGLIKQANFDSTVDMLMECDEHTMKMHKNLLKEASKGSESLESLSYLGEYKRNEKLAESSSLATLGLSRSGQSIGEAARELTK